MTETEVKVLRDYVAGAPFVEIAKRLRIHLDYVTGIVGRVNFQRGTAVELLRQHNAGAAVSLPRPEAHCATATTAQRPPAMTATTPGPAAADEAAPAPAPARATARTGFGLKTPRRQNPRPAGDALVLPPAAVGGDDAGEEVAADVATGAATSVEPAAAVPRAVAALDDVAALVKQVLAHAYFFTVRWYCPSCVAWHFDPGACATCKSELQPVYLATLPRSIP